MSLMHMNEILIKKINKAAEQFLGQNNARFINTESKDTAACLQYHRICHLAGVFVFFMLRTSSHLILALKSKK